MARTSVFQSFRIGFCLHSKQQRQPFLFYGPKLRWLTTAVLASRVSFIPSGSANAFLCKNFLYSNNSSNAQGTSHHYHHHHHHEHSENNQWRLLKFGSITVGVLGTALAVFSASLTYAKTVAESSASDVLPDLPTFTADDVAAHDAKEKKIWVSFQNGVYDITDFIDKHPGGDKILMASGGALEPFWLLYAVHQQPQILKMLETYRIGNLKEEDRGQSTANMSDPYADEPKRHPALKPSSLKPFNAEPPIQLLVESYYTPNDIFFVRNHLPVPQVNMESYELEVTGIGVRTINLSLEDLKTKFHKHTIDATIQCAGNRRSELSKVKTVKGLNWGAAAISNASWSGARLRDVLLYAGLTDKDEKVKHIQFEGLDTDVTGVSYGASILRDKAMDPKGDVLVAYEMNGKPIPVDHGYPIRLVAPGIVGARSVKWLCRIVTSTEESDSHWQQNDYKGFSPNVDWDNVDFKSAPSIQELPIQSAICDPVDGSNVSPVNGMITVRGYAWSGGGRRVIRVDVSGDDGKTWHTATFQPDNALEPTKSWAWRVWQVDLPIPPNMKNNSEVQIICKATDSSYNVQPDSVDPIWNLRGVLNNAWYKITVKVQHKNK